MSARSVESGGYLEVAADQYGIVSRRDLKMSGLSAQAIRRRVLNGQLEELRPNAFRVPGAPRCWHQELMAVQVWAGPQSRISHRAAARLMQLDAFDEEILEITTTRRLRTADEVIIHQTPLLRPYDRTFIGPLVVTTAARTLLDLGGVADIDQVEDALEDALRRRLTTLAALYWELKQEGGRGLPGSRILAKLLHARPRNYVPMASALEVRIDRVLRVTHLPPYVRQYVVNTRVGVRRPDFAFPQYTVAVEGDGYRQHGGRKAWVYDTQRARALEALGWDIVHVTWEDICHRRDELFEICT